MHVGCCLGCGTPWGAWAQSITTEFVLRGEIAVLKAQLDSLLNRMERGTTTARCCDGRPTIYQSMPMSGGRIAEQRLDHGGWLTMSYLKPCGVL